MFAVNKLDSVQYIAEVVVSVPQHKEVIPAQRLAGKQLEALGSRSVADAVRSFSGVQIKDYGGIGGLKTLDIRSMGSQHLGVFYDGIPIGNAQNGIVDLGKFSMDNIEEISLYNGQRSEIFQSARDFGAAGTIYLRTRHPQFADARKTNATITFRTGSFDLINPALLWEQRINDRIASSLSVEYIGASGKYKFRYRKVLPNGTTAWDTTAVRQNGDIQALRAEASLFGTLAQGKWQVKSYYYNSERGIPGAVVNNVWTHWQRQWDRDFFVQSSWQKHLSNKYEMLVNAKYSNTYLRYLNPDTTQMYLDNHFWQQEVYASIANKYAILPQWDVNLSADYQWNALDADLRNFVQPTRQTALVALATAFEWQRLKAQISTLATYIFEQTNVRNQHYQPRYTPAVFLSYQPFVGIPLHVRAFYKRIFRMPTFNDLYYTEIGNVNLKPEFTTQYNVGLQYAAKFTGLLRQFDFSADAYYNEVTNKIIAVPRGSGQYRWMMMNIGYAEIRGVDVSGRTEWNLPHNVVANILLNYTYQRAQDFSNPNNTATYGGQIAYIPWHSGSANVDLSRHSWDVHYGFIYVGERYRNAANIDVNYEQPWYTHDVAVSKAFKFQRFRGSSFKISAEVNNILDQQYDVIRNYPMPGRNYKFILSVKI
ncbi:ligand-gated channel [Bacteroidia bacterium]|nr:ligand-gated channel [Bacteroidia bacterium]